MSTITPLSSGRGLPDFSVVEFCVMTAVMRLGPQPAPALLPTISDWFGFSVSLSDIEPAIRRLVHQQCLLKEPHGMLRARSGATGPVSRCLIALIRLVGTEFERTLKSADPPMLEHIRRQTAEQDAIEKEAARRIRLGEPMMSAADREEVRARVRRETLKKASSPEPYGKDSKKE